MAMMNNALEHTPQSACAHTRTVWLQVSDVAAQQDVARGHHFAGAGALPRLGLEVVLAQEEIALVTRRDNAARGARERCRQVRLSEAGVLSEGG